MVINFYDVLLNIQWWCQSTFPSKKKKPLSNLVKIIMDFEVKYNVLFVNVFMFSPHPLFLLKTHEHVLYNLITSDWKILKKKKSFRLISVLFEYLFSGGDRSKFYNISWPSKASVWFLTTMILICLAIGKI